MNTPSLARLQLSDYLPSDVQRVIWLDIDTIVRVDLTPLYQMHMENSFAAVGGCKFDFKWCVKEAGTGQMAKLVNLTEENMFNTGVLLIDLTKWGAPTTKYNVTGWGQEL